MENQSIFFGGQQTPDNKTRQFWHQVSNHFWKLWPKMYFGTKLRGGQNLLFKVGGFPNKWECSETDWLERVLSKILLKKGRKKAKNCQSTNEKTKWNWKFRIVVTYKIAVCSHYNLIILPQNKHNFLSLSLLTFVHKCSLFLVVFSPLKIWACFVEHFKLKTNICIQYLIGPFA